MTEQTISTRPTLARRAVGWGLSLLVLVVAALALRGRWSDVDSSAGLPGIWWMLVTIPINVVANGVLSDAWRRSVELTGAKLRWWTAADIWSWSQLSRLLGPGATVGARALLARRHGVSVTVGAATSLLEIVWMLSTTPLLILATLPWWLPDAPDSIAWVRWLVVVPVLVLTTLALAPRVVLGATSRFVGLIPFLGERGARMSAAVDALEISGTDARLLLRRYLLNIGLRLAGFLAIFVGMVGTDVSRELLLRAVGGFALGRFIGALALFAPGGIGPREGVTAAVLGPEMGGAAALVLVAVNRLLEFIAEIVFIGMAKAAVRRER